MNTYQTFIGIDPGLSGAIASISPAGIHFIDCPIIKVSGKTKPNPTLMASELRRLITPDSIIIIESVHAMPGQGVSSMFSFGLGYGVWLGIVAALNVPIEFVTPQAWKKYYSLGPDKEASRVKALQLFPSQASELKLKKHHGRAEALLLAEYLRRKLLVNVA
ncbi:MAG: hypothetical protein ACKPH7_02335 [Planktothrix sp.]|uniref:hypothetical protein n=1 Tax=Planktothrix sp. TaxID=3088171 RepID=UPI0038D3A853